jgi:hypothetical protein
MTEIRVDTIVDAAGTGAPDFTTAPTVGGVALGSLATSSFTSSASAPSSPSDGAVWWDTANSALKIYANSGWRTVTLGVIPLGSGYFGDRMLVGSGNTDAGAGITNAIRYIDITGSGGSSGFGSLTANRGSASGATGIDYRGLFIAGVSSSAWLNIIEYVTTTTTGNSVDFGDTVASGISNVAAASNGVTAMYAMGEYQGTSIEKVTIATTGNASAWSGSLSNSRNNGTAASDGTKGFFMGGLPIPNNGVTQNTIDYFTISTDSSATDWGDLTQSKYGGRAVGNEDRILYGGGKNSSELNSIDYFSTASAGNAYDFGDLTYSVRAPIASNNETKAVWVGGWTGSARVTTQNIVTIDTAANATTFGSFAFNISHGAGLSGAAS